MRMTVLLLRVSHVVIATECSYRITTLDFQPLKLDFRDWTVKVGDECNPFCPGTCSCRGATLQISLREIACPKLAP